MFGPEFKLLTYLGYTNLELANCTILTELVFGRGPERCIARGL